MSCGVLQGSILGPLLARTSYSHEYSVRNVSVILDMNIAYEYKGSAAMNIAYETLA